MAPEGRRLAYTRTEFDMNIYRVDFSSAGTSPSEPVRLISSSSSEQKPQYSPDGSRIAFVSSRTGSREIWVCDQDGANPTRLTSFLDRSGVGQAWVPMWSPDGTRIAFRYREQDELSDVCVMSAQGPPVRRLTTHPVDREPWWSSDGKWIYFLSRRTGEPRVWKIAAEGGEAVLLMPEQEHRFLESPDGKTFYIQGKDQAIWSRPAAGGQETKLVENALIARVDERGLYYSRTTDSITYYYLDLESGRERVVGTLPRPRGFGGISLAPDGRSVLYEEVDEFNSDLMLVEGFR